MANQCFNRAKVRSEFRLDPCRLPQTATYFVPKTGNHMICSLNERSVSLKVDNSSNLSRLIPAYHFEGIAARIVETLTGKKAVALELFHTNEEACIPLLVSRDLNNVLLDWRLWGKIYNLPMFMICENKNIITIKDYSILHQFFYMTSPSSSKKGFLLRCGDSLGLRLMITNRIVSQ
ncbi:DUF6101 family protein [Bartonella sp. WD16.2]|uniref:DUF6101 family protein n=1 Tax=Bartonella sp. WD16.2 TaxID=1933904 RepID=UPI00099931B6|nr:DUF6101 family protein [Bartonella sp. WD16.2]AQX19376.1 hypothetical protein BWD162_002420 [Bartonella sp. WD16.2]